jgi:hypothetical protein
MILVAQRMPEIPALTSLMYMATTEDATISVRALHFVDHGEASSDHMRAVRSDIGSVYDPTLQVNGSAGVYYPYRSHKVHGK